MPEGSADIKLHTTGGLAIWRRRIYFQLLIRYSASVPADEYLSAFVHNFINIFLSAPDLRKKDFEKIVLLLRDPDEQKIFSSGNSYKNFIRISFGKPWNNDVDYALMMLGRLVKKML